MNWGWINRLTLFTCSNSWPYICFGNRWTNPPGEIRGTSNARMSTTLMPFHDLTTRHFITPHGTSQKYRLSCKFHPLKPPLRYPGHGIRQVLDRRIRTTSMDSPYSSTRELSFPTFRWWPSCVLWSFRRACPPASDTRLPSLFLSAWLCISILTPDWCPSVPHRVQPSQCAGSRSRVAANTHLRR